MTGALHVLEWKLIGFRKQWRASLPASVLNPLLLLAAMGIGVGSILPSSSTGGPDDFGGVSYLAFVGTGLIAAAAMSVASIECCWPVLFGFVQQRSFQVMASTPVRPVEIVAGIAGFAWARGAMAATGVAVVLLVVDDARSVGLLLAVVFAATAALAVGLPLAAFAATRPGPESFPLIQRLVVTPLVLFGGVLFPITILPGWAGAIIRVTPLWHGIELCRGAVFSTLDGKATIEHLAYLAVWIGVGFALCVRSFARRLESG